MSTLPSWERGRRWSWKAARRSGDPFHRPFMIYGTRSGRCARRPVPARDGLSPSTACLCVALQYCTGWFSWSGNGQRPSNWKVARMTKHATAVPCACQCQCQCEWTPASWAGPDPEPSSRRTEVPKACLPLFGPTIQEACIYKLPDCWHK